MTDHELLSQWTTDYTPSSTRGLLSDVRQFRVVVTKRWDRITTTDIAQYMDRLEKRGTTNGLLRRTVSSLHGVFRFLTAQGVIKTDVAAAYKNRWPEAPRKAETLSRKQVSELFKHVASPREYLCLALSYYGGLTAIEIVNLRWRDVDLKAGIVTLPAVIVRGHPRRLRRNIELPKAVVTLFTAYRVSLGPIRPADPVLPSRKQGGRLLSRQALRIIAEVGERAAIVVNPSLLRTSHAVHAIERGASLADVQTTMGYTTLRSTARYMTATTKAPHSTTSRLL